MTSFMFYMISDRASENRARGHKLYPVTQWVNSHAVLEYDSWIL